MKMPAAAPTTASPFADHDHRQCARDLIERADALCGARGLRLTPVRRRALEILAEAHRALGAYEVLDRLATDGFGKQPPVAYRALDFLVEQGLAHRIGGLNAFTACTHAGESHNPAFFICRACNTVAEAGGPGLRAAVVETADRLGFRAERIAIEVLGLCPACGEGA